MSTTPERLTARTPADSAVIDLEAATRVAAEATITGVDVVRSLAASAQQLEPWPDTVPALGRIAAQFQAVGLRTAYVERPVGDPPSTSDSFDFYATSLDDLATRLDVA